MDRLSKLRAKPERLVVGLNSGTSLDGIDAVLMRVRGSGVTTDFEVLAAYEAPFPPRLARELRGMLEWSTPDVARFSCELGGRFASAALEVARLGGIGDGEIDLVGCHGLTVFHHPSRSTGEFHTTMQIGDAALLVEATHAVVVDDFRIFDMAAGGQGAPLMTFLDWLLFRESPGTVLLNLGGIANLTRVSRALEEVIAFDTGPCNLPLNAVARRLSGDGVEFDEGGRRAAAGTVNEEFLGQLLQHPYIHRPPPKTTGREEFGEAWTEKILHRHAHLPALDILASLSAFVGRHVRRAIDLHVHPRPVHRVIASGGGIHNATVMHHLRSALSPMPVITEGALPFDPDAKEAVLFGILAHERLFDHPTNVPSATGARWPVRLGKLSW